jgi:hypothetical protein
MSCHLALTVRVTPASSNSKPVSAPPKPPAKAVLRTSSWSRICRSLTQPSFGLVLLASTWNQTGIVAVNDDDVSGS